MGLFYTAKPKELLEARNKAFVEKGIPGLLKSGFRPSPYPVFEQGRNHLKDFSYEYCRLTKSSQLETLSVYISRGDRWFKLDLNVFQLTPELTSHDQLKDREGLQFHLPPNSISRMRIRSDYYKGPHLLTVLFRKEYKVGSYYTKSGFHRRIESLGRLLEADMQNMDKFIKRWHELHKPLTVTWEGFPA